ncbi:acyl-CoA dehydratase activase [Treponema pedis]|uniref:acyl-CoA dehydratase activase n=1 Tax=Treponema pedis TaxID=409322 RepID=UPI0004027CBE|nr:acyl-CoA dehydratase activase [Treponema pedis]
MYYAGIDIGSTASKTVIMDGTKQNILYKKILPSGWNSKETGLTIFDWIKETLNGAQVTITATGYGRISVPFADKTVTEITCHGKGAYFLCKKDLTVIDIGGQDTKIIILKNGNVTDFIMNDKCSAGTGKFLEIMANRLGVSLEEMFTLASKGKDINLSSTCTVFAESEVISLIGKGTPREDIAMGVINQIVSKVISLVNRKPLSENYFLTGGFGGSTFVINEIEKKLKKKVFSDKLSVYAGALGACLLGK